MINKYPGTCVDCGNHVSAGSGKTFKQSGRWKVSHNGNCGKGSKPSFKQKYGRCEDAPCCGCCGNGNEYMSAQDYNDSFGGW